MFSLRIWSGQLRLVGELLVLELAAFAAKIGLRKRQKASLSMSRDDRTSP